MVRVDPQGQGLYVNGYNSLPFTMSQTRTLATVGLHKSHQCHERRKKSTFDRAAVDRHSVILLVDSESFVAPAPVVTQCEENSPG